MEASSKRSEKTKKKKSEKENTETQKKKKLPSVWFSLRKSLPCKSDTSDVYNPRSMKELATISTKRPTSSSSCGVGGRSGCSRSIANLKDVINGSKQHLERPPCSSPRSIGSSEFLNPIAHDVIFSNSTCELKITGATEFVGTLRPGTPVNYSSSRRNQASRKASSLVVSERDREGVGFHHSRRERDRDSAINGDNSSVSCHKCGDKFTKIEAAEAHHLTKHAVTELMEGDSSRKIVEIICRTSWLKTENQGGRIDRILKVHNMQKTLARFEEYRDTVKIRASKLQKKHPRCIADGNELLRFHGTTVACALGINGSTSLCSSEKCCVCRIIRNGFSAKREMNNGIGVFTASTSERAFESIVIGDGGGGGDRKALIVCRVIAGRVHRPVENLEEMSGLLLNGFDSLAGKVGLYTHVEELYLLNSRALLPCFVLICKP
ncbi:hypothetical protein CARUB_v10004841mg [Capsella rubella]|uniref:C2H2-type domain-containing protein n=1 Tax=Capsella rubella TaxID=81985 RepID=R0GZR3_9BRAS|nr:uncharacterized protein LOC17879225 [Capsella rubella]EOA16658.1 hypothetical protein CARUB_v10004841mg [Capsella rubella]